MAAPAGPAKPPLADADVLERWNTPDGARLAIRPMRSDDAEQELDFLQSLSTQTLCERAFSHRALAPGELNKLIRFDVREEVALVAVVTKDSGTAFVAVARLKKVRGTDHCEFAIVVADDWQRRGVGLRLLEKLIEVSRRVGVGRVTGYTFSTNEAMKALARRAGFALQSDPSDASITLLETDLSPTYSPAPPGVHA